MLSDNVIYNFYYFINPIGNSLYLFHEYGDIPLPDSVKECFLKCKNFNIVFLNEHEYEEYEYLEFIQKAKDQDSHSDK